MFFVEAFYPDGREILGSGDGQYSYSGADYFRTLHYKELSRNGHRFPRVHHWHVIAVSQSDKYKPGAGRCVRVIGNNPAHWRKPA